MLFLFCGRPPPRRRHSFDGQVSISDALPSILTDAKSWGVRVRAQAIEILLGCRQFRAEVQEVALKMRVVGLPRRGQPGRRPLALQWELHSQIHQKRGICMAALQGYLDVVVTKENGEEEDVHIPGEQFGLEEGGDWRREDDAWLCGFIFIAFCDGFDAVLSFGLVDDTISGYSLTFRITSTDVKAVAVDEDGDELDVSPCFRSEDDEYY